VRRRARYRKLQSKVPGNPMDQLAVSNGNQLDIAELFDVFQRDQGTQIHPPDQASNEKMVEVLSAVLRNQPGGPNKFSVMGFDHHFMQGFTIVNEFQAIAQNILGSQSFVPDHGK
jgi:hypothetical protein